MIQQAPGGRPARWRRQDWAVGLTRISLSVMRRGAGDGEGDDLGDVLGGDDELLVLDPGTLSELDVLPAPAANRY